MRQPEATKTSPDGAAMNLDAIMRLGQFRDQFIKRDLALGRNTGRDPISHAGQFAMPAAVALWARRQ